MKQLIIDYLPFHITPNQINESLSSNNGKLLVKGVLQRAEAKNQNGRRYPKNILTREAQKYSELIKQRRALGELDHPESPIINLNNVSHNIVEMHWDGNDLVGTVEVLTTPAGNILRELFKSGITLGISSRGMGSVKQLGETVEVQDDFELLCWDLVSVPSTPEAYMHPVGKLTSMNESKQYKVAKDYSKVNSLITEIICSQTGVCPLC